MEAGKVERVPAAHDSGGSYEALVNQSLEAIYVIQGNRIVFVNPAWERLFGWSRAEACAEDFHYMRVVAPGSLAAVRDRVRRIDAGLEVVSRFELRGISRAGMEFDLVCSVATVEWGGRPAVQGVYHDVTHLVRAQAALERALTLYRATIEATADGILVMAPDGRIVSFNRKLAEMWRIPDAVAATRDQAMVVRLAGELLDEPAVFTSRMMALNEDPVTTEHGEIAFRDGRVLEWFSQPQRLLGPPEGRVWSFRDVTDRRAAEADVRQSNSLLAAVIDGTADTIFVKDLEGRYILANAAFGRFCRCPVSGLIGRSDADLFTTEQAELFHATDQRVIATGDPVVFDSPVEVDGLPLVHQVTKSPVRDAAGRIIGVVGVARDVTERLESERQLRESEARYAASAAGANDGLWDWNLRAGQVYFSPRWKSMLGYALDEIDDDPDEWMGRVHADDALALRAQLDAHLAGTTAFFESTHRMRHRDGSWRWMLTRGLAVRDGRGEAYRMAGSQTDVTERKQAEEQLLHDALHDALTGLPNRVLLIEELRLVLDRRLRRPEHSFAVLLLDLDGFRLVNESLGHVVGDQLLIAMAGRLRRCLRPGDRVARLGGDEFANLLDDASIDEATSVADRIQAELVHPFVIAGHEIYTTVSIGIALSGTGYTQPEHVLRDADLAMYRAKAMGRSRYEVFDQGMYTRAVERLELETNLRRAVDRHELCLLYQPIIALSERRVVGFEALLRWDHPRRGRLMPEEFLPVAEATNLMPAVGRFALFEACRQLRVWQDASPAPPRPGVAVNVSGRHLLEPSLADDVAAALRESALDPGDLTLEITETVIMEHAEDSAAALARLKKLGVKVHMDDFGTGYSSLSYLHRFPVDALKIDRYFVSRMQDPENLELVRTIITLARNLGLGVVAEGVETTAQELQLGALDCDLVQGFLYARPLEAAAAGAMLTRAEPLE